MVDEFKEEVKRKKEEVRVATLLCVMLSISLRQKTGKQETVKGQFSARRIGMKTPKTENI